MTDRQYDNRIKKLIELKIAKQDLERQISAIQDEIKAEMGEEMIVETSNFFIRNTEFERRTVDSKKLKTKHPRIYLECSAVSVCRRFSYTEK